jgi:hypothetical protein
MIIKLLYFCGWFGMILSLTILAGLVFVIKIAWFQKAQQTVINFVPSRIDLIVDWALDRILKG